MGKLTLGMVLLFFCAMSFAKETEKPKKREMKVEKSSLALHCEVSEARDDKGRGIARGTCCKDVPNGATLLQQVVIIVSLRECAENAMNRSLEISVTD